MGLALFASETSHIGKWMTEAFETAFTPVDEEKFSKTGMAFGSRLIEELQNVRADLPSLEGEISMFVRKCVNPEFIGNTKVLDDLVKSTDLWGFIGATNGPANSFSLNPARSTFVNNTALPCPDAYAALTVLLDGQTNNQIGVLGARVNPGNSMASTVILSQIPAVEAALLDVSRTAQDAVRQSIVANLLRDCRAQPLSMQSGCVQSSAAVAMAEESAKVSYAAMAKVAAATLPKLRNAIELITIGVFPVVFLLIVIAGAKAGMVLKSYVAAMFWVQLWAPLYAIINAMAVKSDKADLLGIVHLAGGTTLANMTRLGNEALSNQSIAGLLTISVPVIALALIKGGEVAMSGVASSIMGPAQGAAQKAGDSIGQGNITGGTVTWGNVNMSGTSSGSWSSNGRSWDTTNANKYNTSPHRQGTDMQTGAGPHGSWTTDAASNLTGVTSNRVSLPGEVNMALGPAAANAKASGAVTAGTESRTTTNAAQSSAIFSSGLGAGAGFTTGTSVSNYLGAGNTWQIGNATNQDVGSALTVSGGSGTQRNRNESLGLSAGLSGPEAPAIGGGGGNGPANSPGASAAGPGSSPGRFNIGRLLPFSAGIAGNDSLGQGYWANTDSQASYKLGSSLTTGQNRAADQGVKGETTDRGGRTATSDVQSTRLKGHSTTDTRASSLTTTTSAGTSDTRTNSGSVGGSVDKSSDVFMALVAAEGGNLNGTPAEKQRAIGLGLAAANNPEKLAAAVRSVSEAASGSPSGRSFLGHGGADRPPVSQGEVAAGAEAKIAERKAAGRGAVAAAGAAHDSRVANEQVAPSTTVPSLGPAQAAVNQTTGDVAQTGAVQADAASVSAGALSAGGAIYQDRNSSAGNAALNALGIKGLKAHHSAKDYQTILNNVAQTDPAVRSELKSISERGGYVSPGQTEFLTSKVKDYLDKQPRN